LGCGLAGKVSWMTSPAWLVDGTRYPVDHPDGGIGRAAIGRARDQLAATGAAELPGFVTAAGVEALAGEARQLAGRAHWSGGRGSAYLAEPDPSCPPSHPRRWQGAYRVGVVAYDLIPRSSWLRRLYEWAPVMEWVEAVLGRGRLYRYADPFGALNVAVMGDGDQLQWHFDQSEFVVSLALQPAQAGGLFEVAPLIRDGADEGYEEVAGVLAGDRARVETLAMEPGTLLVFAGRHSLHRVSPVEGPLPRLVALLAYDTKPDATGTDALLLDRYGRTEPYLEPPPG